MDTRYSTATDRNDYIIPTGHILQDPAVIVNTNMNKWAEQILLILSSILIMVFLSLGMFISVLAELAMHR